MSTPDADEHDELKPAAVKSSTDGTPPMEANIPAALGFVYTNCLAPVNRRIRPAGPLRRRCAWIYLRRQVC
jgi:hypothetical protein